MAELGSAQPQLVSLYSPKYFPSIATWNSTFWLFLHTDRQTNQQTLLPIEALGRSLETASVSLKILETWSTATKYGDCSCKVNQVAEDAKFKRGKAPLFLTSHDRVAVTVTPVTCMTSVSQMGIEIWNAQCDRPLHMAGVTLKGCHLVSESFTTLEQYGVWHCHSSTQYSAIYVINNYLMWNKDGPA